MISKFKVTTSKGVVTLPALFPKNPQKVLHALKDPDFKATIAKEEFICHTLIDYRCEHAFIENALIADSGSCSLNRHLAKAAIRLSDQEMYKIRCAWVDHMIKSLGEKHEPS